MTTRAQDTRHTESPAAAGSEVATQNIAASRSAAPTQDAAPARSEVRLSQIIAALSYALDLTEGQPLGHAVQSCILGMKIAEDLELPMFEKEQLYYALLLKDAGCSSNASRLFQVLGSDERQAKHDLKTSDWTRVSWDSLQYLRRNVKPDRPLIERLVRMFQMAVGLKEQSRILIKTRCERGASIARKMGFSEPTSAAIHSLDEHWDGEGYPQGLRGNAVPMFSRIMNLAQTLDVYATLRGPEEAIQVAQERSGRWFDPDLVRIVVSWTPQAEIWKQLEPETAQLLVEQMAPAVDHVFVDEARLDSICEAFADVIDAKSPYTYRHSNGVSEAAIGMTRQLGLNDETETVIRRAALLHDIGKLSVSNTILEKPGKLNDAEWEVMRKHPYYTQRILEKVPIFREFAFAASSHHEKLDGSGYYRKLRAEEIPLPARILTIADIYDALCSDRPYREGMPLERAMAIMAEEVPHALDPDCYEALRAVTEQPDWQESVAALGGVR